MKTLKTELDAFLKWYRLSPKYSFLLKHYPTHENDMNISQKRVRWDLVSDFLSTDCLLVDIPLNYEIDIILIAYISSLQDYKAFLEWVVNTDLYHLLKYHAHFKQWSKSIHSSADLDFILREAQIFCYTEALNKIKNEFVKFLLKGIRN